MKSRIKRLLAAGLLATCPLASAQGTLDYLGAQLAIGVVEDLDDPLSLVLTAGKELPATAEGLALELEFTDSISAAKERGVSLSYWTLGGYAAMTVPMGERLNGRARAGARLLKAYANGEEEDDLGLSFGLGLAYRFAANVSFLGEFTRLGEIDTDGDDLSVNHLSAGIQVRL